MEDKLIEPKQDTTEISLKELILKFREWWRFILSKWITIIAFSILGGALGFLYAWSKKPIYTATTTFVLEAGESGGGLGQYAGIASMAGIDLGGGGGGIFQGENILELYKSRSMIEKTLLSEVKFNGKNKLLIEYYIDFNGLRKRWAKDENKKINVIRFTKYPKINIADVRLRDSILGTISTDINKNYLIVSKPDKKLNIIKVDVKSNDEFFAKNFNDKIVQNVNDFYIQTKTKKSLDNVAIMQQKTDSVRRAMNGAIYSSAAIADATPNLNPTKQVQRVAPMQRSQFTVETNKAVLGELLKNLELSKIALLKETPLVQIVDDPVYPLDKVKLGKLKGIVIGGFIFGFLTTLILLTKKILKSIMA